MAPGWGPARSHLDFTKPRTPTIRIHAERIHAEVSVPWVGVVGPPPLLPLSLVGDVE